MKPNDGLAIAPWAFPGRERDLGVGGPISESLGKKEWQAGGRYRIGQLKEMAASRPNCSQCLIGGLSVRALGGGVDMRHELLLEDRRHVELFSHRERLTGLS